MRFFTGAGLLILGVLLVGCSTPEPASEALPNGPSGRAVVVDDPGQGNAVPASRSTSSGLTKEEIETLVTLHNQVRAEVGVGPLVWSREVAAFAQAWADHLAGDGCSMEHRPREGEWAQQYGENLFMGSAGFYGVKDAVQGWESEKKDYDGGPISQNNFSVVGHHTQMVWRATTTLGCGQATCSDQVIIACNYDPAGNYLGEKPY